MTSTTFFILFIPILAIILLLVNLVLAPHNPYQEKDSAFECGFHSFLGQNRTQFSISFFIFALLFLLFDLEILLVYPYSVSSYINDIYGLTIMMIFFVLLTLGFIFELGKNALNIDSKQIILFSSKNTINLDTFSNSLNSTFTLTNLLLLFISSFVFYYIVRELYYIVKKWRASTLYEECGRLYERLTFLCRENEELNRRKDFLTCGYRGRKHSRRVRYLINKMEMNRKEYKKLRYNYTKWIFKCARLGHPIVRLQSTGPIK